MISSSGLGPESSQRATPPPRPPKPNWTAHVALVVLAVVLASMLADRGYGNILQAASRIWIPALIFVLFTAQALIVRRAGGTFGSGIGYWLCAAGALCTILSYDAKSRSLVIAFSVASAVLFLSGTIALIVQLRRIARSREAKL